MSNIWTGKGAGKKIAIKFTEPLFGDVSGLSHPPAGGYEELIFSLSGVTITASDTYSTNVPGRAFDGSTSTYWETRTALPQWIQWDFGEDGARVATRFKYYSGASYRIRAYNLAGSNDLESWDELWSGENAASTGWRDISFENTTAYRYYRWTVTTLWTSGRIYVYELELWGLHAIGNNKAFTVKGMVPDPLQHGELTEKTFTVDSVERKTDDIIILTCDWNNRFNDVRGDITVNYDDTIGNLRGEALVVESFEETFTPEDLEPTPIHEHIITVTAGDIEVDFLNVTYIDGYHEENITVEGTEVFVDFINVEDIPP